jgi:hypothetical protein
MTASVPIADDFEHIARILAHLKQERKEQQDRDNAAEAAEAERQRQQVLGV